MGVVVHDGKKIPTVKDTTFDPDATKLIAFSYDEDLTITDSEFILADGMQEISKEMGIPVTLDTASGQVIYENCNVVLVKFNNLPEGKYLITNRVSFSNDEEDDKSCWITIKEN